MEVFTKYFRRLLLTNAGQIWGGGRSTDSTGSYPILRTEVEKITQDPLQADKIVESIEYGDGEIFKDFDLSLVQFAMESLLQTSFASIRLKTTDGKGIPQKPPKLLASIQMPKADRGIKLQNRASRQQPD